MVSDGILQQISLSSRVQLQDSWQRNTSNYLSSEIIATLSQRYIKPHKDLDWPSEPGVLHNCQKAQLEASLYTWQGSTLCSTIILASLWVLLKLEFLVVWVIKEIAFESDEQALLMDI